MARLGDYIQEETHPLGEGGGVGLSMIGVSNERGLEVSSRSTSANIARYIEVRKDWFAYNPMRINVGSIGLADDDSKTGYTSPDYTVFSCKDGLLPKYLLRFLKSEYGLEAVARHSSGAVRKRLYFSGLSEIELEIPSIEDQQKSINRFEKVENAAKFILEKNSDSIEIPLLKQAILQEAIQGKLTADWRAANPNVEPASELLQHIQAEKDRLIAEKKIRKEKTLPEITPEEIPFEIPDGWEWCRLGNTAIEAAYGTSQKAHLEPDGVPVLRMGNVTLDGHLTLDSLKYVSPDIKDLPRLYLESGDLVFNRTNSLELVGKSAVFREESPFTLASYLIRVRLFTELSPEYFAGYLNSTVCRTEFIEPGVIQQNGQANFNGTKLKNIPVPLPPLAEQAAIVERVEALMATCRELEAEIERSRTHAADLLQAVLKEAFAPAS
jgi:type I restriction enzyme S subunit